MIGAGEVTTGKKGEFGREEKGGETVEEEEVVLAVEVVCNTERARERFGESGKRKSRVCSNLVCVVLGEAPQHGWI